MSSSIRRMVGPAAALALFGVLGCDAEMDHPVGGTPPPGTPPPPGVLPPVTGCMPIDSDGDGIADGIEGMGDVDADGMPNHLDLDSDADGVSDADERGHDGSNPCTGPRNSDGFTDAPDFADNDNDNDGLSDVEERAMGTNPDARDTDGDMYTDLAETAAGTSPTDPSSTIPATDFFVVLPYQGEHVKRTLTFGSNISVADIYFLIDTTGSMGGPIANVQSSLTRIAADISATIPDVQMGVGHFEDFPCCSDLFGDFTTYYGDAGDLPYEHLQDITDDLAQVQNGLNALALGSGGDGPESTMEALYLAATGEGLSWSGPNPGSIPSRTCPAVLDEPGSRRGYPCFRSGALPIIVHVTDIQAHNGPAGANAYRDDLIGTRTHTFDDAVSALNGIGARIIGVAVSGGGADHLDELARATGSVDGSGNTLTQSASGGEVSDAIIDAIGVLAGGTPQDVGTRVENIPERNPDGFDATTFIKSIVPVEGIRDGIRGTGYSSKDDRVFYDVIPGTLLEFDVDFHNDVRPPAATAQIFLARILVVGNGVATLDARNVYIIVPPEGGTILF
ncbi:MAG: hypothetical protein IT379_21655 [Deltaproteobacteria bacterium]|nr:hypothetical protein [Deltaproteobacteria bacterium]